VVGAAQQAVDEPAHEGGVEAVLGLQPGQPGVRNSLRRYIGTYVGNSGIDTHLKGTVSRKHIPILWYILFLKLSLNGLPANPCKTDSIKGHSVYCF